MKILYVTTVGTTMTFFKALIRQLTDEGHTVDIATNEAGGEIPACYREWGCPIHALSCSRSPLDRGNLDAVKQIRAIVERGGYDIVHCHTPIAAALTRLACRGLRGKNGLRVFYTAHGFHFYTGAPLKNWLVYYPVERLCSRWTDVLITINREDYERAKKRLRAKETAYVPGVGIDLTRFSPDTVTEGQRKSVRAELGLGDEDKLLLSVGELNANKNHGTVIRAVAELRDPRIHYAVAGTGGLMEDLAGLSERLGIAGQVHLLGYRVDVEALYRGADLFVFPSRREGLPVSVMEAMASGLPVVCSDIRGNRDLVRSGRSGILCPPDDAAAFAAAIAKLLKDDSLRLQMGERGRADMTEFGEKAVCRRMRELYGLG